jgi:acetolactate synthase-1/2/3 large subunit
VSMTHSDRTTAQAYLELLAHRGIDYFFANAGTDFAPLIDAFTKLSTLHIDHPKPIAVPHENAAVAMAHGYYLITGKPQVVMVHVNVGTANALNGIINASRDHIPILFTAGRTPLTEFGFPGSRNMFIHWGQEVFDQAAIVREYVKWEYELRRPEQLETVVDRALQIAMTEPKGPVYLTLPREVLAERAADCASDETVRRHAGGTIHPDPRSVAAAAEIIAAAEHPLIITTAAGRSAEAVEGLVALAETFAIPVVAFNQRNMCFPTDHPMHVGFSPAPFLDLADAILVIESEVPWYPAVGRPSASCKVMHVGVDPAYGDYPIRSFPCDISLRAAPEAALPLLHEALKPHRDRARRTIEARFKRVAELHDRQREDWHTAVESSADDSPVDPQWVSYCVNDMIDDDTIVFNEFDLDLTQTRLRRPLSYFGTSPAGGLGWALGASLGAKLAAPDRLVITAVGDGSYIFGNPVACHFVAQAQSLPTLTVIFNNKAWNSVRLATLAMYPTGWSARTGDFPLTQLEPSPQYEHIVLASGGYGERVEHRSDVRPALKRALTAVQREGRPAVLNVICTQV